MNVLVVDDSAVMRKIHQKALSSLGWQVYLAEDGADALQKLGELAECQLLLTDLHMPNMDGLQLTEAVRKMTKYASIKILMVTSDGVLETVTKAVEAGADDVLIKPFTPDVFVKRVQGVMGA